MSVKDFPTLRRIAEPDDVSPRLAQLLNGGRLVLTVPEVGQALLISRSKAYELVASGQIPSIVVGRVRRVPVAALNDWIEEQMESAAG